MNKTLITICDNDWFSNQVTLSMLKKQGFDRVCLIHSPQLLLDKLQNTKYKNPEIIILDVCLGNDIQKDKKIIKIIKEKYTDIVVICVGEVKSRSPHIPINALIDGCDSWIEKTKNTIYTDSLIQAVAHWSQYIREKKNLSALYDTLIDPKQQNYVAS